MSRTVVAVTLLLLGIVVLGTPGCGGATAPQTASSTSGGSDSLMPEPEPSPSTWSAASLPSTALTYKFKTSTDYTCAVKVTVWEPVPNDIQSPVSHPLDDTVLIDPTSDYDPNADVVIPFALTLTNTTRGFDLENARIAYTLVTPMQPARRAMKEPRTIEAWDYYSDGSDVTTWDVSTNGGPNSGFLYSSLEGDGQALPSISWSEPLSSGDHVLHCGYFVYRDERSPAEPQGAAWALDELMVAPVYGGDEAPATSSLTRTRISLAGKVHSGPFFGDW